MIKIILLLWCILSMKITIRDKILNWNEYIAKERSNLYLASKIKKKELEIVRYATIGMKYTGKYPIKLICTWHFKDKRKDLDNCKLKGVLDGLVKCGVIKNDNLNCITTIIYKSVVDGEEYLEMEIMEDNNE